MPSVMEASHKNHRPLIKQSLIDEEEEEEYSIFH